MATAKTFLLGAILVVTACGKKATVHQPPANLPASPSPTTTQASGSTEASTPTLAASAGLALGLAAGSSDSIVAVGRASGSSITVAMASGTSFTVDLVLAVATPLPPPYPADTGATLMTSSASYAWEYTATSTTLGRNISAIVSGQDVQIGKVSIGDLLATGETATPLALSDTQIFFYTKSSLLVFAWENAAIERRKVPFSTWTLAKGETVLGAGPLNPGSDDESYWVATSKRVLQFASGQWTTQTWQMPTTNPPQFISAYYAKAGADSSGMIVGTLSGNKLSAFSLTSALAAPQAATAASGS